MIKINLIKSKIINYNYINFITFMHYKVDTFNNNILISPIIIFTISSNIIKINIIFINFTTNLATKLNTNFSNITSYKATLSYTKRLILLLYPFSLQRKTILLL